MSSQTRSLQDSAETERVYAQNQSMLVRRLDDELVVYERESRAIHRLNDTAGFVWELCDGSRNVRQISTELPNRYAVSADRSLEVVVGTLRQLNRQGLVFPAKP